MTVYEVADLLRINQQTVRNWIDQGLLPAVRVGRRVRIDAAELDRFIADGSRVKVPDAAGLAQSSTTLSPPCMARSIASSWGRL